MALPRSPEDMQRAFVANNGSKVLTDIQKASDRAKKRRAAVARESIRQARREGFLAGVRAERLHNQRGDGVRNWCELCGVEHNPELLVLHHPEKRSQGRGFEAGRSYGVDSPSLVVLACPSCHEDEHPGPAFGARMDG